MKSLSEFIKSYINDNYEDIIEKFREYEKILLDWNKKFNLISRKQSGIEKIIIDSIFFLSDYKFIGNEKVIDIGSGGGFPGIPLKIIYPRLKITLLDSIQKKVKVLNDIVNKLNLADTETVCARAESLSKDIKYKNKYDIVISRAVSELSNLYKWSKDFLNSSGKMICIKGGNINKEVNTFRKNCKFNNIEIKSYSLKSLIPNYLTGEADCSSDVEELKHIIILK